MIPPLALDGLKLSTELPNEVITVALSLDDESGELLGFRVFPSVIGPVIPIDVETAEDIIRLANDDEGNESILHR